MSTPRLSLLRKGAARLAAVQAMYSEELIETSTLPALLANQLLQSWADSRSNDTDDLPHAVQPEPALLNKLIESAQKNHAQISAAMEQNILPHWKKERMSLPLRAVLQVCAAEALISKINRATLIREYTEVAAQLLTDEELSYAHKAFNLLLDALR